MQGFQCCHVLVQIEAIDQRAHLRNEVGVFGVIASYFVQLDLDRPDIAQLPKTDLVSGYLYDWHETPIKEDGSWYVGVVNSELAIPAAMDC